MQEEPIFYQGQTLTKCSLVQMIRTLLSKIILTNQQSKDIAKLLVDGVIELEQTETPQERQIVSSIFNQQNIESIRNGQLFYNGVLNMLEDSKIGQNSKSRIYHMIANIKRQPDAEQIYQYNEYGIQCVRGSGYKQLSDSELEEIVKYQTIALKIRKFAQKIKDKLQFFKRHPQRRINFVDMDPRPFDSFLQEIIDQRQDQLTQLNISIDPSLQDLICVAFRISLGQWDENIGRLINQAINKEETSPKLKSVILSIFFNQLDLPTEAQIMQHFFLLYKQSQQKVYMQEYIKQNYSIQKSFLYATQNYRLYHRTLQLKNISCHKEQISSEYMEKTILFAQNIVFQQYSCLQKIRSIFELLKLKFIFDKEENFYFQWIQSQLQQINQCLQVLILKKQIQLVKVEGLILQNQLYQGVQCLYEALQVFESNGVPEREMECYILLAECSIKMNDWSIEQANDHYQSQVIQKANALGQQLKGVLYADSLWRIQNYLWQRSQEQQEQCLILRLFTAKALKQMSQCKGSSFIYALMQRWYLYDINMLPRPLIKNNIKIKHMQLRDIGRKGCYYLFKSGWKNLTTLNLYSNKIEDRGCSIISKAGWKNVEALNLYRNNIEAKGCKYLSRANWQKLKILNLYHNKIGPEGCQFLSQANWNNLTTLNLNSNKIDNLGCLYLSKSNWQNLKTLDLWNNNIEAEGCLYLSKANWKKLTTLILAYNIIRSQGCLHLSKGKWKNLTTLQLYLNNIGAKGCLFLSQAGWNNITSLQLRWNNIGAEGCLYLSKAGWKNLTLLNLQKNNVGDQGCLHLSKADWKVMSTLVLENNDITTEGCLYLSKSNWISLRVLNLQENSKKLNEKYVKRMFIQKNLKIEF